MNPTPTGSPSRREERWQRRLESERRRRERAEAELHALRDRFRLFLEHAPMPAFIRDERGRHVYGNKPWAAQFDRPLDELLGRTNWELFPKETALVFETSDHAARERGEVSGLLESGIAPDGKRHWWKVFKFPLPGEEGGTWIGGLALDVSDLVHATARLASFEHDLAAGRLVSEAPQGDPGVLQRLPPRLRQVLELLAAGWTIKEIAGRLGISQKTAEAHRTKLLQRLGLRSVVEATRFYVEHRSHLPTHHAGSTESPCP
ncbi:MAG: LuxR C-terminal-related transcriptional regulator [Verrucomicrobiota bacterium]